MSNTRAIATQILTAVIRDKHSLTQSFQQRLPGHLSGRDQGLIKEYCYGVLRFYFRLKLIADALVYKPVKSREQDIASLLLIGLYQLIYLNTPPHAAVSETVAAAQTLKKTWAKGFINQALQQFLRNPQQFLQKVDANMEGQFAHPQWMIDMLQKAWPEHWQAILLANNQQAPLFLRVNLRKNSRSAYQQRLLQQQINTFVEADFPQALRLAQPCAVEQLPGFNEGCCSIQDLASQAAAHLLDLQPHQRVLDACAAPGGKTAHILELAPAVSQLIALDQDAGRLARVSENIARLKLPTTHLQLLVADAAQPETWWDGQLFDRILLDAPCSGSGVIRRHPDIKLLRRPEDIQSCAQQQHRLLSALWPLLKPGGRLLYTTCSVFPLENAAIINHFCEKHSDAIALPVPLINSGIPQKFGYQLFPSAQYHDGFFYAPLLKAQ